MGEGLKMVKCPKCGHQGLLVLTHKGFVARAIKCNRLKCDWRVELDTEEERG